MVGQRTINNFPYLDNFTLPQAGEAGGVASGTERYYSFDCAHIHFICLDSMTSGRATNTAMFQWLRSDLEATAQEWIIAFWHHPPYTKGNHNSDLEPDLVEIRRNFLPLLESHGVDLVLAGHSHCYERSFLLNGHYGLSSTFNATMQVDAGDGRTNGAGAYIKSAGSGTVYTVAGHGGQATGGALDHPAMFRSLNELGSLIIDVNSNRLDLQMLGVSAVGDTFTLIKQSAPTPGVPAPGRVEELRLAVVAAPGTPVRLYFPTVTGRRYGVEWTDHLGDAGGWQPVTGAADLAGTGTMVQVTDPEAAGQPRRFYRVRAL